MSYSDYIWVSEIQDESDDYNLEGREQGATHLNLL